MKIIILITLFAFSMGPILSQEKDSFKPPKGFIPDEKTAISVALAVLYPIFGEKTINFEKPFKATLIKGVWTVVGTLPKGIDGGVALIQIRKSDGQIIQVSHGQ